MMMSIKYFRINLCRLKISFNCLHLNNIIAHRLNNKKSSDLQQQKKIMN